MDVKESSLAGTWYAADRLHLAAQVDELLAGVAPAAIVSAPLTAIVVPHAGYVYSGRAAAAGYACLRSAAYVRAVMLAPSHFAAFSGAALLDVAAFVTPLGRVTVDRDAVAALGRAALFAPLPAAFREEHALEIQLPFLQRVCPDIRVVPVLLGAVAQRDQEQIADTLARLDDAHTVFVVSSDFVHYGWRFAYEPFAATDAAAVRAALRTLDGGAIERVCAGDAEGFRRYVADTGATICGQVPIAVFLSMHRRRSAGRLLEYYTSLDVTGDYEHTVSYASIAFPRAA